MLVMVVNEVVLLVFTVINSCEREAPLVLIVVNGCISGSGFCRRQTGQSLPCFIYPK